MGRDWNDPGAGDPLALADAGWTAGKQGTGFGSTSAAAIALMDLPPIKYVVPSILTEGLNLLAGRPKTGKSWLALGIGGAVASGGTALGTIRCEQGDVLYLALEDNNRRIQRRLRQMFPHGDIPTRLFVETQAPRLSDGLIPMLEEWIVRAARPRLIVIDVFKKVKAKSNASEPLYDNDYASAEPLKALADKHGIAILVLHHTRKLDAEDPFDTVSGTTGLTGVVDAAIVMMRDAQGTTLYGRGRDIEEFEKAIRFDAITGSWLLLGDAAEAYRSEERNRILAALKAEGEPMSPKSIEGATGIKNNNVRVLLLKMAKAGEVEKTQRGLYRLPGLGAVPPSNNGHNDNDRGGWVS
jgi:hypothetical protein